MNTTYAIIARIHDNTKHSFFDTIIYRHNNYNQIYSKFEEIMREVNLEDLSEMYSVDTTIECCIARINIQKDFQLINNKNQLHIEANLTTDNINATHRFPVSRKDFPENLDSEEAIKTAKTFLKGIEEDIYQNEPDQNLNVSLEFIRFIKDEA